MPFDLDISFLVSGLPFDGNTLERRSLGGSESAGLYMAKELSKLGHHVKMFCNTQEMSRDDEGVEYYPLSMWAMNRVEPNDVAIVQRLPEMCASRRNTKLNLLWMHDLAQVRAAKTLAAVMWNVDKVMVVSEYMRDQYKEVAGLLDSDFFVTRNGVDLRLILDLPTARDRFKLVYAARPERGLDVLLRDIMPELRRRDERFHLHIYGYDNPVEHLRPFYDQCKRMADELGCVKWHAPMPKDELYEEYCRAGCYVYPTPSPVMPAFAEVSCISLMEAQACGLPFVSHDIGALRETLGDGVGSLLPWSGKLDVPAFCSAVMGHVLGEDRADVARKRASQLGWREVALAWSDMMEEEIDKRNNDANRLALHLWRQSDIVALDYMAKRQPPPPLNCGHEKLLEPFAFAFGTREEFAAQYARIGETHNAQIFPQIQTEQRFQAMAEWLKVHDEIASVLDYGCGLGGYSAWGAKHTGKRFYGVDVDPRTIEIAREESEKIGLTRDAVRFYVGTHEEMPELPQVDCGVLQEVLEHVPRPWEVVEAVEAKVAPGGWVYITVPYGPWEYESYDTYPWRCHIWHFDKHDLRDLFGHKPGLSIASLAMGDSSLLGDPLGWWIVTYLADHTPIGRIDMERKLALQAPRQTVSASLIVGGEHDGGTLGWCLDSLKHVADEIVIADCGMREDALRIAMDHNARIVPGLDPKQQGFDAARNVSLGYCKYDWVLWIDSDEKLVHPRAIQKYLRENRFHGYGIRQHHFACDTTFTPDMPVRLFRNRDWDGRRLRFFGCIHEHPELALNEGPGPVVVLSDAHIAHVGYLIEGTRQARFVRNYGLLKMDKERYPDRLIQKHFIMRDNLILAREALRMNGGVIDAGVRSACEEVVRLYREHFMGKGLYANADSLQYYSEALEILQEGFDVAWQFDAQKDGQAKVNGVQHYRFASKEDLMTELGKRIAEKVDPFSSRWY